MMRLTLPQPYEELPHTADAGVRVRGSSAEETLARLVCVFGRLLSGTDRLAPTRLATITVEGGDLPLAAVDVLRELLYRFDTEAAVPSGCTVRRLDRDAVEVEVELAPFEPEKHEGLALKAVTLHRARFEPERSGWLAEVVFDV